MRLSLLLAASAAALLTACSGEKPAAPAAAAPKAAIGTFGVDLTAMEAVAFIGYIASGLPAQLAKAAHPGPTLLVPAGVAVARG